MIKETFSLPSECPSVPPNKLWMEVIHLEMTEPPSKPGRQAPEPNLVITHMEKPTVEFYRWIYDAVGSQWMWHVRKLITDEALAAIIHDSQVEIHLFSQDDAVVGYAEIDRRDPANAEIAFFGLLPDFVGRGLGPYFLDQVIRLAWMKNAKRVWLHTCIFDHPKAVATYKNSGLKVFKHEAYVIEDPRPAIGAIKPL
jgi:GNAT superfamily N-acetyltransferase